MSSRFAFLVAGFAFSASGQVQSVIRPPEGFAAPGAAVRWVQPVAAYCEGPAPDGRGEIFFTEQHGKDTLAWPIWRLSESDPEGTGARFLESSDQANGLAFDPQGRLVACQRRKVSRFGADGTAKVVADSSREAPFSFGNDLAFVSDGSFYFTAMDANVYAVGAEGGLRVLRAGLKGANGLFLAEERGLLYVCDAADSLLYRFEVREGGALSPGRALFRVNRPDGMTLDSLGNLYIASYADGAVLVFDPEGKPLGRIEVIPPPAYNVRKGPGGNVSNCAFGGPDLKTLYITGDGGLYALRLAVPGRSKLPRTAPSALRAPPGPRAKAWRQIGSGRAHDAQASPFRWPSLLLGRRNLYFPP